MISRLRWVAKKSARHAVVLAGAPLRSLARLAFPPATGVRVLMYHRVRRAPRDPFSVAPEAFSRQMAWLAERGLAISLSTLKTHLESDSALPNGAVLVTIDDGFCDLYTEILPRLQRYRIPAVAFVTVGRIENRCAAPDSADAYLSWTELAALAATGVTVASHGWDHVSLAGLTATRLAYEVEQSRRELEHRLGIAVEALAYPFGARGDFSAATEHALVNAGYSLAFTAQHGAVRDGANRLALPRVKIEGGEGMWMFRQIVQGGLDGWRVVDRCLSRLQATEPLGATALATAPLRGSSVK